MADKFSALRTSREEPSLFEQVRTAAQITPEAQYEMTSGASDTQFEKGLRTGAAGLTAGSFANEALSQEVGGDAGWQRSRDLALQTHAQGQMYAPRVSSLRDIGSLEDAGDFAAGAFGQGVMSMAPTMATALLTRGRGKFGAATSFAGGATTAYGLERGEAALNQYADPTLAKTSAEDRDLAATTKGVINAGLESIVPAGLAGSVLRKPAGSFLGHVGREALTEGLTEAAQQGVSFGAEKYLDPNRQLDPWDVADAFAAGALTGGGMSAATRGPAHGAQALVDRFARGQEGGAQVQEQGPAAEPPMDAAPPGTPLLPAPDDGTGGGVGGLFDTLNERFGPGMREQAHKAKDYVSDTIDRMSEAAKTAQTPEEFLRQVFSSSTEDAAAADLLPDTEDPGVMSAADPAAALQQRDAERQERAAAFAEELLNDPATPDTVKERVASFGGDFTDPEARAFVTRTLVAQRAGEKLTNAVNDLIDLSKDFGGRAAEAGTDLAAKARDMVDKGMTAATDRIVKKNLQGISLVDAKPLVDVLAQRLGPSGAAKAPELARQLLALSVRMSPEIRITPEVDSRLRSLSDAIDDNVLDTVTEVSGSEGLRQALARIREIPSAQTDVATSDGSSFLESMLVRPLADGQRKQLATVIDEAGLQLKGLNPTRRDQLLTGLAAAFGSKENAQTVVEFYGNLRREAMRRRAENGSDPDDLFDQPGEDAVYEAPRPTGDAYEGTDDVAEFGTLPERDAPVQDTYYADAKSMRPFYEGREGRLSTEGGSRRRIRDIEAFMDRMQGRGVELRSQRYGDFLKERNEDSAEAVKRIRKDLEKRIAEGAPRKGEAAEYAEGRKKNLQYLEEQLLALNLIEEADGPEAAANLFSVARAVGERNELGITDAQLAESDTLLRRTVDPKKRPPGMTWKQAIKHNRDIAKTKIVFNRTDGQPLALSAESLWKAYAKGQPAGRSVRQLFADAVSAVLNRPDIADLEHGLYGLYGTLIDRESGTYADPQMPDDVREVKKELAHEYEARLSEAESRVEAAASEIEDARDEDRADGKLVERIEEAADELQREADSGRITATALKDEAKSIKWEDGAPTPEAIELRARAAWEYDISRVFAEGARGLRETAMEVRIELERVGDNTPDVDFGEEREAPAKARNYDESTGAALHPDDKPSPAKPKGLGKRLDAALLANPELLEVLDARGQPKDKAMTESRMRENLFKAYAAVKTPALKARLEGLRAKYQEAKNASNVGAPAAREAAKQEAAVLKEIGQMVRWIVEQREGSNADTTPAAPARVTLPQTSRYAAKDQAKSDRANKFIGRGAPGSSTAAYAEAWGDRANVGKYSPEDTVFISVNGNRPGALSPPWPEIKKAMSAGATLITDVPADRNRSFNTGERAVADFLDGNGYFEESPGTWVRGYDIDNATGQKRFAPLGEGGRTDAESAPKRDDAMARIAALPDTVERVVDGTRVLYVKDAGATKYIAGTRGGVVYVNMGKLRADGMVKYLTEGPSAAQKQAVFDKLGITAQSLDAVLGNDKRRAAFLRDHELSHIRNKDEATYPRDGDGKPDLMHPDAIAIESRAIRDALTKEELAALGANASQQVPKTSQGKVVKKSFVGAKADPRGAAEASGALDSGASAELVWAMHGWFRGPDGKMRKELRSPVLRARVREFAENLLGQRKGIAQADSKSVSTDQFFNGVPGYEKLLGALSKYTIKLEDSPEVGLKGMVGVVAGGTRTLMMSVDGAAQKAALRKYTVAELTPIIASGVLDPTKMLSSTQDAIREGHLSKFESVEAFEREVLAEIEKSIHHELQHMLQGVEGFENGGNPTMAIVSKYGDLSAFEKALMNDDLRAAMAEVERAQSAMLADIGPDADSAAVAQDLYRDLMGEAEAHDVEARFNLSDEEAKRILPELMEPNREFLRGIKVAIDSAKLVDKQNRQTTEKSAMRVKKSFVGAKADPEGASDAEKLLGIGAPADVVWRDLGWFRGPDGKLRKEIRSPVLRRRVRDFATAIANGSRDAVTVRDLLAGIDAFKPYLDKLGDMPVDPNDGMVELMGAVGAYNGEDGGFSSRGIGISRVNAELGVRVDAVPGGKGIDLLRELADSAIPPELKDAGLNFADPRVLIAQFEDRHPMPDVDERVAEMLAGTILHELQHAFQHVEGFENGGNATTAVIAKYGDADEYLAAVRDGDDGTVESITEQAFAQMRAEIGPDDDMDAAAHKLYESITGEVEANDVAARMKLSDEEAASLKPALMDAKREFVRSVLLAEALSTFRSKVGSSKVGGRPGRPGKNWGDKDAVKAEILRLRGKDVKVKVEKLVKQLGGSGQYTYNPDTGERLIEVAINAQSTVGTARHEAMHDLFRFLSENDATRSVAKDLRDATSAPHVIKQLRDLLKDHKPALEQLNDPEERAAYAYQFWAEGLLRIGPTGTGIFHTIRQFIKDLFGIVTAGQRGEDLMRAFHDGKFADPSIVQEVLQDINDSSGDRVANKLNRVAPALTRALNSLLSAAPERLRRFENDYLNELADKFQPENGTGFVQNRFQQEGVWTNRLGGILRGTTAVERREAIDQLQAMKPTSKLAKELAKFNEDIYEYMRDAGVQSWDSTTKKFVPLRKVQGYFTRSWDPDAIAGNRAEFEALLRKEGRVSAADAAMIAGNLARGTEARPGPKESPVDLGFMPYAPHTSERVLTFINPGNADKFAKFQRKDLADIMMSYVRGSTHRAEYAREFGNNGEKIVDLVTKSGVKDPKELEEISNAVQALEGSLDPGNWSVQTKEAMSALMTLQNATLLPLALVSQMIDPIVLAARTGDLKDAGTAYVTALKRLKNTIAKSKNKVPGEELAEILGVVSEDSTLQAMSMAYGTTRMSKRMENINRVFFKYNGMQGWNNSMRIAATAAGERYLLAHRKDAKALAELGLEPKDIKTVFSSRGVKPDANNRVVLRERLDVSNPKVQQAMFQFVDQAVLRPSAANRPVWMSDPRFLLVAHLKQFTFAMHNVVLKRANRELQNDNPKPWGTLMLAMPVILAADMAKFALTGTAPSTWGFKDYVLHAVERSGLLGIGDFGVQAMGRVDSGKMPGEGLLGPTFENLMEILRWIGGDPRTDFGDVLDRTVPGSRFI